MPELKGAMINRREMLQGMAVAVCSLGKIVYYPGNRVKNHLEKV